MQAKASSLYQSLLLLLLWNMSTDFLTTDEEFAKKSLANIVIYQHPK